MGATKKRREIYKEGNSDGIGFVGFVVRPKLGLIFMLWKGKSESVGKRGT